MCGIVGAIHAEHIRSTLEPSEARRAIATLEHRGPDDGGLWMENGAMLGHRRLSILDLSAVGRQPMSDASGRYWITYNGELYNYRELRSELQGLGIRFRSECDTEVVLASFAKWGSDCLNRFNGMFAFGIWDRIEKRLTLARDHAGIKPLFYTQDQNRIAFASEIKAILALPDTQARMDESSLLRFFTFGYVAAPSTGFEGIKQLRPGHFLTWKNGVIEDRAWYKLPYPSSVPKMSMQDATERLDSALSNAVRSQMISDVPLGAFLSGGLDSSAIVRAMKQNQANSKAIHTYSIGFREGSFDESPYADEVAAFYGTKHQSDSFSNASIDSLLPYVYHAEDPLADNSMLPVYQLCQATSQHVKVALSGDGADELLGGYDTYRATELARWIQRIPSSLRSVLTGIINGFPVSEKKYSLASFATRFLQGAEHPFPMNHASWRRMVEPGLGKELFEPEYLGRISNENPLQDYVASLDSAPPWADSLTQLLHLDCSFHLPNDMLVKVDRMSMAHSLEVRVPWLDRNVIKACLALPSSVKRAGKNGKLVLKQLLSQDLSHQLIHRRKAGFVIPIESWLRTKWQPLLHEFLDRKFCEDTGVLRWPCVERMLKEHSSRKRDHAYALFTLLIFAVWHRLWISKSIAFTPKLTRTVTQLSDLSAVSAKKW